MKHRWHIFDLDHTLFKKNCSFAFGSFLFHHQFISSWKLFRAICDYVQHKAFGMSMQKLHQRASDRLFNEILPCQMELLVQEFLHSNFFPEPYFPAMENLRIAHEKGEIILILSSSPDFLVKPIGDLLGVIYSQGTSYKNFIFQGVAFDGEAKAQYLQTFAIQQNLLLTDATIYSDSYLDLSLLQLAGEPIAVCPDRKLRKICLQNGWKIL